MKQVNFRDSQGNYYTGQVYEGGGSSFKYWNELSFFGKVLYVLTAPFYICLNQILDAAAISLAVWGITAFLGFGAELTSFLIAGLVINGVKNAFKVFTGTGYWDNPSESRCLVLLAMLVRLIFCIPPQVVVFAVIFGLFLLMRA
ncbi:MAG: hypothetical protein IJZ72_09210 [Oscillospiraceae bacterium]|nr:hypothetical protein [Oscillospiraceae bacterium]